MLKKSASSVLASFRPSTYPRGYASALHSLRPCWTAILSILRTIETLACQHSFPQPVRRRLYAVAAPRVSLRSFFRPSSTPQPVVQAYAPADRPGHAASLQSHVPMAGCSKENLAPRRVPARAARPDRNTRLRISPPLSSRLRDRPTRRFSKYPAQT